MRKEEQMNTRRFAIAPVFRSRLVALVILFGLSIVLAAGSAERVVAQDISAEGHPLVGTWIIDAGDDGPAIASLTNDGIAIDVESTGEVGLGSWSATSATAGNVTFVLFFEDTENDVAGSIIIRATLDYDEATDTASGTYTVTGVGFDGMDYFSDDGVVTANRLLAEGPEMGGTPIPGLVTAPPEATPAA
jgi:hypothetical protein